MNALNTTDHHRRGSGNSGGGVHSIRICGGRGRAFRRITRLFRVFHATCARECLREHMLTVLTTQLWRCYSGCHDDGGGTRNGATAHRDRKESDNG